MIELVLAGLFRDVRHEGRCEGRAFTDADRQGSPPVVVRERIGRSALLACRRCRRQAAAQRVAEDPATTVVGVVPDTRYRDLRDAKASIYFPLAQSEFPFAPTNLVIRTRADPASVVPSIRRAISESAPGVLLSSASPFDTYLAGPLAQPRFNALLLAVFAVAAVALAAVGLFGIMMTMVGQRTRELGIRMALGATSRDIRDLVLGRGFVIAAAGAVAGLLALDSRESSRAVHALPGEPGRRRHARRRCGAAARRRDGCDVHPGPVEHANRSGDRASLRCLGRDASPRSISARRTEADRCLTCGDKRRPDRGGGSRCRSRTSADPPPSRRIGRTP